MDEVIFEDVSLDEEHSKQTSTKVRILLRPVNTIQDNAHQNTIQQKRSIFVRIKQLFRNLSCFSKDQSLTSNHSDKLLDKDNSTSHSNWKSNLLTDS